MRVHKRLSDTSNGLALKKTSCVCVGEYGENEAC